ncbi:MAG TPA: hypothetical protein VIL51_05440 [Thermoleophilia bacterium]
MPEDNMNTASPNPVFQKIGYRTGSHGIIIGAPEGDGNPLDPLAEGLVSLATTDDLKVVEGDLDYIHLFVNNRAELAHHIGVLRDRLAPGGMLWVSWIKQASAKRRGGLMGDLNESVIRKLALSSGLVDVKVASLDSDWSALKLVRRKH